MASHRFPGGHLRHASAVRTGEHIDTYLRYLHGGRGSPLRARGHSGRYGWLTWESMGESCPPLPLSRSNRVPISSFPHRAVRDRAARHHRHPGVASSRAPARRLTWGAAAPQWACSSPYAPLANPCGSARLPTVCVPWGRTSPARSRPWRSAAFVRSIPDPHDARARLVEPPIPAATPPTGISPPTRLVHRRPRRLAPPVSRLTLPLCATACRRPDSPCSMTSGTEPPSPSATPPCALGPMSCSPGRETTPRHSWSAALRSAPRHFVGALGSADYDPQGLIRRLLRGSGPG